MPSITAAAAQGLRIMPIRSSEPSVDLSAASRRLSLLLRSFREAIGRPAHPGYRSARSAATIGTGTGHAARGQVVRSNDRITDVPGPGCAGDAEPMARRTDKWVTGRDCEFC